MEPLPQLPPLSTSGAISVLSTETLKAIAAASGYANMPWPPRSTPSTYPTPQQPRQPSRPRPALYTSAQTVTIPDATASSTIYYTSNGTTPTASSAAYAGPIPVSATETIPGIRHSQQLYSNSAVATAAYTINIPIPTAATPTFSPPPGSYTSPQSVSISDSTTGAAIYYTIQRNGSYDFFRSLHRANHRHRNKNHPGHRNRQWRYKQHRRGRGLHHRSTGARLYHRRDSSVTLTPGASTGNTSTITITPIAGSHRGQGLSAAISAAPAGAQNTPTFSFGATSPVAISGADAAVATLTVSTTSESSATSAYPARTRWPLFRSRRNYGLPASLLHSCSTPLADDALS